MEFKYCIALDDLKKIYYYNQKQYDFIILIIASTYYIILNICLSILTFNLFYLSYMIYLAIVWLILNGINRFYVKYMLKAANDYRLNVNKATTIMIDDLMISQHNDEIKAELPWQQISRLLYRDDKIVITPLKWHQAPWVIYRAGFKNKKDFEQLVEYLQLHFNNK